MLNVANLTEIQGLIDQGAEFFVGHSGGKDSQAMFAALVKIVPADQLHVVHADLGDVEHLDVKTFIRENIDGKDLHVAQAVHADGSKKDFFSMIRARRVALDTKTAKYPNARFDAPAFPSSQARFCTSDLKTGPIWKKIRNLTDAKIVVNCVGIRGQESPARAKKIRDRGTLNLNKKNTNSVRDAYDFWPIADWSIDQVWNEIAEKGQVRHPAYDAGNDRLSCAFCIFGSQGDLRNAAAQRPELLAKLTQLEIDVRTTMFNGATLAEKIGNVAGIPVRIES